MRKVGRALLAVAVILGLALAAWLGWLIRGPYRGYEAVQFSAAAWKRGDAEMRGYMVDDLLAARRLAGMSFQDVRELLGSPNVSFPADEAAREPGQLSRSGLDVAPASVAYDVGYMGFDKDYPFVFSYTLLISFRDGRVVEAHVFE